MEIIWTWRKIAIFSSFFVLQEVVYFTESRESLFTYILGIEAQKKGRKKLHASFCFHSVAAREEEASSYSNEDRAAKMYYNRDPSRRAIGRLHSQIHKYYSVSQYIPK